MRKKVAGKADPKNRHHLWMEPPGTVSVLLAGQVDQHRPLINRLHLCKAPVEIDGQPYVTGGVATAITSYFCPSPLPGFD